MIPLSHWLQCCPGDPRSLVPEINAPPETPDKFEETPDVQVMPEVGPGSQVREEELLAALRHAERNLEELTAARTDRDRLLMEQLGEEMRNRLASEIGQTFRELLLMIEESLYQTLLPFLGDQASIKATSELVELVRVELSQAGSPIVEIKAPAELHDALSKLPECMDVSISLARSHVVEVVLAARHARFEELASRWRAEIGGPAG